MTDFDYPAAHSMDTIWYAVDEAGHVAALLTGENGSLPDGAASGQLLDDLGLVALDPADPARFDYIDTAQSVGVYVYEFEDDTVHL